MSSCDLFQSGQSLSPYVINAYSARAGRRRKLYTLCVIIVILHVLLARRFIFTMGIVRVGTEKRMVPFSIVQRGNRSLERWHWEWNDYEEKSRIHAEIRESFGSARKG